MSSSSGGNSPTGVEAEPSKQSWAAILGKSLVNSKNKNVLEIVLEKEARGSYSVSETDCARLMVKLGLDMRPGVHVEGVQIGPSGKRVVLVTLRDDININRFCRYDVIDVTESGVRAVMTKPVGRSEVVVSIRGIHPNTKDELVFDYLERF